MTRKKPAKLPAERLPRCRLINFWLYREKNKLIFHRVFHHKFWEKDVDNFNIRIRETGPRETNDATVGESRQSYQRLSQCRSINFGIYISRKKARSFRHTNLMKKNKCIQLTNPEEPMAPIETGFHKSKGS